MHQKPSYKFNTGKGQFFPLSFVPVIFYRKSDGFIVYAYDAVIADGNPMGLTSKNEWKDNGTEFFLPIRAVSKSFRGKYIDELKHLWNTGQLEFHGTAEKYRNYYVFKDLLDSCYDTEWIPYCKKTFNGAQSVIDYLGKYTHRIAISNHRIICMDDGNVTFSVKDYRNKGQWKELTLSGVELYDGF